MLIKYQHFYLLPVIILVWSQQVCVIILVVAISRVAIKRQHALLDNSTYLSSTALIELELILLVMEDIEGFIAESWDDIKSPTTSDFTSKTQQLKELIGNFDQVCHSIIL